VLAGSSIIHRQAHLRLDHLVLAVHQQSSGKEKITGATSLRRRRWTEQSKFVAMVSGADTRDLSGLPRRLVVAGDRRWAAWHRATSEGDSGIQGATGGNDRTWMRKGNLLLLEW
jgi:hypothetical protein